MKKILVLFLLLYGAMAFGQNTYKYPVHANGGIRIGGATNPLIDSITLQAGKLRVMRGNNLQTLDGHLPTNNPTATGVLTTPSLIVGNSASNTKVQLDSIGLVGSQVAFYDDSGDTLGLYTRYTDRENGVALADSGVYNGGYITPTINTASKIQFMIDVTAGSPAAGDSIFTSSDFVNKHIEVYRGAKGDSLHKQYRNPTGSLQINYDGYRFQKSTGEIIFKPVFTANEFIAIEATDSTQWKDLSMPLYTEYQTIYNAMGTKPTGDTIYWQDDLVYSLDSAGYWDRIKLLYVPIAASSLSDSYLNWTAVNNTGNYTLTLGDAPVLDRVNGWIGNGSSDYLKTGWIPQTDSLLTNHGGAEPSGIGNNDITLGVWSLTNVNNVYVPIGVDGTNTSLRFYSRNGNVISSIINGIDLEPLGDPGSTVGLITVTRRGEHEVESYFNGSHVGDGVIASYGLPDNQLYLMARNNIGTADRFYPGIISIILIMDGVTDGDQLGIYNIFHRYMTRIGK